MAAEQPRLVLLTADTVGGVWTYAVELAQALGAHGVRTAIATMGAPLDAAQRAQIAKVSSATVHESSFRLEWMDAPWSDVARCGEWLLGLERELDPDIVHLNQFAFGGLPFTAPVLVVGHSCVLSWWRAVHGAPAPVAWDRYREAVQRGLAGADLVVAPTRAMRDALEREYGPLSRSSVIPNARTAGAFAPGEKRPFVFAAGRVWDEAKNIAALQAIAFEIAWPIYVAGPQQAPGSAQARDPRWTQGLRMLGPLASHELVARLASASIYALPARYEPFGLSALEAGLARCALVLGDVPSLREVWGDAALFVPPDDHGALADALQRLIADAALRESFAARARARALEYTPAAMAAGYLAAYGQLRVRAMAGEVA